MHHPALQGIGMTQKACHGVHVPGDQCLSDVGGADCQPIYRHLRPHRDSGKARCVKDCPQILRRALPTGSETVVETANHAPASTATDKQVTEGGGRQGAYLPEITQAGKVNAQSCAQTQLLPQGGQMGALRLQGRRSRSRRSRTEIRRGAKETEYSAKAPGQPFPACTDSLPEYCLMCEMDTVKVPKTIDGSKPSRGIHRPWGRCPQVKKNQAHFHHYNPDCGSGWSDIG